MAQDGAPSAKDDDAMADTDSDTPPRVIPEPMVADSPAPLTPDPAPVTSAPRRRGSALPAVLGGVLAATAGFGLAQVVPGGWPLQATAALEQRLSEQAATLTAQEAALNSLTEQVASLAARPAPEPATDPALAARVAALESAGSSAPGYDDTALLARVAALEDRLSAMAAMPADGNTGAMAAAVAALQAEVAALQAAGTGGDTTAIAAAAAAAEARLAEVEASTIALQTAAEARAAQTLARANLAQIGLAINSGQPYDSLLAALDQDDIPAILLDHAATGLPTLSDLQDAFPAAASAAIDASLRADMGEGWTDRMTNFLRSQTGARSVTPREGDDPDAILSRAEAALATGGVDEALALIATLPDAGKAMMADWVSRAQLYTEAGQALAGLVAAVEVPE
ncbi:MAG: hypothetical protein MUD11_03010 [Rhodobacteraceae bacterium]|nr:hypothetical protein [Paracoccaceae bacterium]